MERKTIENEGQDPRWNVAQAAAERQQDDDAFRDNFERLKAERRARENA